MKLKLISLILVLVLSTLGLCSCSEEYRHYHREDYYTLPGWSCTDEDFVGAYFDTVKLKIEQLLDIYDLGLEPKYEIDPLTADTPSILMYMYNDIATVYVHLNNFNAYGDIWVEFMFYGNEFITWKDYEYQKPYVDFINDLTNYLAYDTITTENRFETLYNECMDEVEYDNYNYIGFSKYDIYHFDQFIGNVGYRVTLNSNEGYYYKFGKNEDLVKMANYFRFEGLLKPLS